MTTGQRRTVIVGTGRIGTALAVPAPGRSLTMLSGRAVLEDPDLIPLDTDLVIHAAGPAGEDACQADPAMATALHETLTTRLVEWAIVGPSRRLICLGTVAPAAGFYGSLKRTALAHARTYVNHVGCGHRLRVIECGQVIGEGMPLGAVDGGVVAAFLRRAMAGQRLLVNGQGTQTIRYTPLSSLVRVLAAIRLHWPKYEVLSPVSEPITILDLARLCLRVAGRDVVSASASAHTDTTPAGSYTDPTGELVPVAALDEVLAQWMTAAQRERP
jgi:nucleoside-diphosphate-sugar epimerase